MSAAAINKIPLQTPANTSRSKRHVSPSILPFYTSHFLPLSNSTAQNQAGQQEVPLHLHRQWCSTISGGPRPSSQTPGAAPFSACCDLSRLLLLPLQALLGTDLALPCPVLGPLMALWKSRGRVYWSVQGWRILPKEMPPRAPGSQSREFDWYVGDRPC